MKRTISRLVSCCAMLVLVAAVSGCRAFNSDYSSSPELQEMLSKPLPSANKPKPPADPSVSTATVDYSKDTTQCETPEGVTVGVVSGAIVSNWGWATASDDSEKVAVSAAKKGPNSATITVRKENASGVASVLSFTVKQTDAAKFSACDFSYTEGERSYPAVTGSVMVKLVNAVDEKAATITNSGTFSLTFGRETSATKAQSIYMASSSASDVAGILLDGIYFVTATSEAAE